MFRGSIVALVTPMTDDEVDVKALRELVEFHISAGTHGIVAAGTTGESGTLSHDEKLLVIKTVIQQARERIPVIAGTAANATKDCVRLTQEAMGCGAHAALIMTPAYIKPTQEGLYQHYSQIANSVPIPIILYNVPSRTACDLLPETVARLGKISNIVGIKEATGQMTRLQQILRLCEGMDVYSGDDATAAQWMLAGAKGVISVTTNVAARQMAKMADAALDDDHAGCVRLNEQLSKLHELLFVEANPIPVKWALSKMGLIKDELRLPLTSLSAQYHSALEQVLRDLQLV
ncbi:4-hydroxy-tetrahydrodipicolinate synthase [Legionella jordanis]|uniref:4-hydroxy-tetrahydrodipicolinate synthase n=1 Tax=Legionella jordanis TaxID=456 RepID=A0A0W0VET5_9GAMM|nr:4-hydroxy-tetrahydrodipicolinate synthase [Legionella jordanis]KTD18397.1 dihydrodipicolinate synthase [Legionella jordanis]RMX05305.1 4-hydroxy-tetrahydrodipicolinate synthase [Legionella jordanis]RMX20844.1 4-hydroxy-tetrahydrodipicolinate synthase [Legionella jordanis]VEH13257.1 dihydrodipicolinate synthase [Legionella jordanis]HAT8713608.1 4-hydroxy-tetrahydrodipicolinate synthase [Legionella jordanis]